MNEIVQKDNPILREISKSVPLEKINSPEIKSIISRMAKAVSSQKDGVAIAAPQIGESLRIFLVRGELLKQADKDYKGDGLDLVFINPEIIKYSKDKKKVEEGCLSVRWIYGKVRRCTRITLRAYNEKGEKIERGAKGLLAQIFQHEMDHLEGRLFVDGADELWEMSDEEIAEIEGSKAK